MELSMIAATDFNSGIGKDNELMWVLPEDFKFFRKMTVGKAVLMGRKTYESIGKPLPKRFNIVLSSDPEYAPEGVTVVRSIEEAISINNYAEMVIIGGGQVYKKYLDLVDTLYITKVDANHLEADTFFPEIDPSIWKVKTDHKFLADDNNCFNMNFITYKRVKNES